MARANSLDSTVPTQRRRRSLVLVGSVSLRCLAGVHVDSMSPASRYSAEWCRVPRCADTIVMVAHCKDELRIDARSIVNL